MGDRKPYPSDLSDERWVLIEPVITAWKQRHPSVSGHEGRYRMREIVNAILYQARTGCQWRYLPHDLPPHTAVYYYFAAWRDDGTDQYHPRPFALPSTRAGRTARGSQRGGAGHPDRSRLDQRAGRHHRAGRG